MFTLPVNVWLSAPPAAQRLIEAVGAPRQSRGADSTGTISIVSFSERRNTTSPVAMPIAASVSARARAHEIQGLHRTWFAGAYWGWGFHEDGIRSGEEVAAQIEAGATRRLEVVA